MIKKEPRIKKPMGISFPVEPQEVIADRRRKNEEKMKIALELGVDITRFDGNNSDLFRNKAERIQYEQDTINLTRLLNAGKPIPEDLKQRLLKVKKLKDNKGIKY